MYVISNKGAIVLEFGFNQAARCDYMAKHRIAMICYLLSIWIIQYDGHSLTILHARHTDIALSTVRA